MGGHRHHVLLLILPRVVTFMVRNTVTASLPVLSCCSCTARLISTPICQVGLDRESWPHVVGRTPPVQGTAAI